MSSTQPIYRQRSGIVARAVLDEYILIPVEAELGAMHSFFTLNDVGRFIWERLDGVNDLATIAASIERTYDTDPDTASADVFQLVEELKQAGLVTPVKEVD